MRTNSEPGKKQWYRQESAEKQAEFEKRMQQIPSQRQVAKELDIPRTTLQHWLKRREQIDADPALVAFLHRLVLAAHFVMTLMGPCGVRWVCLSVHQR